MSLQKILNMMPKYRVDEITRVKMANMLCELPIEKWQNFCENESELVFGFIQSYDITAFYTNDGWFKLYKCILEKHPEYISYISAYGPDKQRLTQEQYNELLEIGKIHLGDFNNITQYKKNKELNDFHSAILEL
jgi:hypothetical protein